MERVDIRHAFPLLPLLATVRLNGPLQQAGTGQGEEHEALPLRRRPVGSRAWDAVHDVTEAQTEIRKSSPYAMKGDALVAALPQWRERIERMADKAPGMPIAQVKLLAPVARPTKLSCAPTNYQAHIEEMRKAAQQPGSQIVSAQSSKILEAGMFLKANSALVGPSEGIPIALSRPPQRSRGRTGDGDRQSRQRHSAGQSAGPCRRLLPRPRHDGARPRRPQLSQIGRWLCRARPLDGDGRRNP